MTPVGLFVLGDEILSGKRQDKHLSRVIDVLAARGMALEWARFIGDDQARIARAIVEVRDCGEVLLSCGGIGATPDDVTRQAAAAAFAVPIERHVEGLELIDAEYGSAAHPNRVLMVDFPQGASLIPNPVNRVPGFFLETCFFVPGFPEMAWPMLEWVLDTQLTHLHNKLPPVEYRLRAIGTSGEGDLLPLMQSVLAEFPGIKLSSLPFRGDADTPRHIEFGFKGERAQALAAFSRLREGLAAYSNVTNETLPPRGLKENL